MLQLNIICVKQGGEYWIFPDPYIFMSLQMHLETTAFDHNCLSQLRVPHPPLGKDYKAEKHGRITQCATEKPNSCSRNQI